MRQKVSYRCPHCGKPLSAERPYTCPACGDLHEIKAHTVIVTLSPPTDEEQKVYDDLGFNVDLNNSLRVSVRMGDRFGYCFMQKREVDKLGLDYIADHVELEYSSVTDEYYVRLSQNDFYNDPSRNPEKIIPVRFVEIENGTGREVYRGLDTDRYYLREVSGREAFAKWLICGSRRILDDGNEPRANLIFSCEGQTEKVTYDDWNGVCAYSGTFNRDFRPHMTEK